MKPWVLIDLSFLGYRALHAIDGLEHEDVPTGVLFGFFVMLRKICEDPLVNSNRVAIFCDSKSSFRKDVYPPYKEKRRQARTKKQEEIRERIHIMRDQINLLEGSVLKEVGFPVYKQEGLESDDLIASAARKLTISATFGGPRLRGVMITSDGDLYQCMTEAVHWYDTQRHRYYEPSTFRQEHGIDPSKWGKVKQIGGCSSDCVKGVPGVGEGTAIQHILGTLNPAYKRAKAITARAGKAVIERNWELVVLPHPRTEPVILQDPKYDIDAFMTFCKRYGLASFIKERRVWETFFNPARRFMSRKRGEKPRGFDL